MAKKKAVKESSALIDTLEEDPDLKDLPAARLFEEEQEMRDRVERVRREIRMNRAYLPPADSSGEADQR